MSETKYIECILTKDIPDNQLCIRTNAMVPEQFAKEGKLVDIWQWGKWSKGWTVEKVFEDIFVESEYLVRNNESKFKPLAEYQRLSEVPLEHPEVKFKCSDPGVICPDAVGNFGCLGIDHKEHECQFMLDEK